MLEGDPKQLQGGEQLEIRTRISELEFGFRQLEQQLGIATMGAGRLRARLPGSQLRYLVGSLTKQNFNASVTELDRLLATFGVEATRFLLGALLQEVQAANLLDAPHRDNPKCVASPPRFAGECLRMMDGHKRWEFCSFSWTATTDRPWDRGTGQGPVRGIERGSKIQKSKNAYSTFLAEWAMVQGYQKLPFFGPIFCQFLAIFFGHFSCEFFIECDATAGCYFFKFPQGPPCK